MGIKYVENRHGSDNRERRRDAVDSAFLLDPPSAPDHSVLHSVKRRPPQTRERRRAAVDSSFLLDSLLASDHDALHDTAAEPPRQSAKRRPPQTSEESAATERPTLGPRTAVPARPLKSLGHVRLPHDWEQALTSRGVSSAPGFLAQGGAKHARAVRRKRRAVLWVICAIVLFASLLLVLWYSAAPGIFSL
jgi:hypothetical protein